MSLGLIGWRGDRLRSPGAIDSPVSREGAFLANNVLFTVFAFVVLLGTVFPLLVEALQDRRTVVGAPYFDRLSMPIGIALLFLMAVAPVLPWRKASGELLPRAPVLAGVGRRRRDRRRRPRRGDGLLVARRVRSRGCRGGRRACARSCWRRAARAGAASSAGPTAG